MVPELPEISLNGYYNQTQVAKILGVCRDSVYRWIKMPGGLRVEYSKRTGYPLIQGKEIVRFFHERMF